MSLTNLLLLMFGAAFAENIIFSRLYGSRLFFDAADTPDTALSIGAVMTFIMTLSSAAAWAVYHLILLPLGLGYLRLIAFVLVIAALAQLTELLLRKFLPALRSAVGEYFPLVALNCAVPGIALVNAEEGFGLAASVACGFASAIGFTLAILVLAGVRGRLQFADPPRAFRGFPLTLVAAGLLAMAFSGFSGIRF